MSRPAKPRVSPSPHQNHSPSETGGAIGLAVARELHTLGPRLVLTAWSEDRLSLIPTKLAAASLAAGITETDVPGRLLATALERYGRRDVVINNAGIIETGPIESIDIDGACSIVRVNVEAAHRVAYTFIRHFVRQDFRHVINISSAMGTKARPTAGINVPHPLEPEDMPRCVSFVLTQPLNVRIPRLMILPAEHQIWPREHLLDRCARHSHRRLDQGPRRERASPPGPRGKQN